MNSENATTGTPVEPIVESCGGCGVCCMHMATPPFDDDEEAQLPDNLKASLAAVRETRRLQYETHGTDYTPCGWFDMETRQCRHHEHRPNVCRDFEIGSEYCVNLRKAAGLSA